ncbi:MAG: hypothetical protein H6746_06375 [Deltaproteobacteria bacterium]|nr:hypothetical protein [Deltaproteobacteria bacterium]
MLAPMSRLAALFLILSTLWSPGARADWSEGLDARLPLATLVRPELQSQTPAQLRSYRALLLRRLLLDEGAVAVSAPRDLHDAVLLATVSALLRGAAGETAADRLDAVRAAYVVHAAGAALAERPRLRAAVDGLSATTGAERTRRLFGALAESARQLEAVGRAWFPDALHRSLADGAGSAELHQLRGLWLEREGRLPEATDALLAAVDLRPTVPAMVDLYRLLVSTGRQDEARTLARALVPRAPGVAGALEAMTVAAGDRAMTKVYEDPRNAPTLEERIAQALRYRRQGLLASALATLEAIEREAPDDPRTRTLAAELWLGAERFGRLAALFEAAEAEGPLSRRLTEARIAATVTARLDRARGGPGHALADRDVSADLARLRALAAAEGPEARARVEQTAREIELVMALAARPLDPRAVQKAIAGLDGAGAGGACGAGAGASGDGPERPGADPAAGAGEGRCPRSGLEGARLVAAAWLVLGRPERAMGALAERAAGLGRYESAALTELLAGLELHQGAKDADRGLIARARDRLEREAPPDATGLAALRDYHALVADRMAAWLREPRGADAPGKEDADALAALMPLVDRLDPTVAMEREAARGAAVAAGALLAWRGDREHAIAALQVARRLGGADALGWLLAGQVAVIGGDAAGATAAFDEALAAAPGKRLAFVIHKWAALAANRSGDAEAMKGHLREMLGLWGDARAAESVAGDRPMALPMGEVGIAVRLEPGAPLQVAVELAPLVVLLPDFPHDRAEIRSVVGSSAAPATGGAAGSGRP